MTVPQIKVRVVRRPSIRLKVMPQFPVSVSALKFIKITHTGQSYIFDVDYTLLPSIATTDPATTQIAVLDGAGTYDRITLSALLSSSLMIEQHITSAGPVAINAGTGIVRVDQTVGAAMTLTMPLASAKTCPVLISDWKGDAGTNNITITLAGADKFPGGLSSWTIGGDTGSVFLRPISGVGYVL